MRLALVVDSPLRIEFLRKAISQAPIFEIAWIAYNSTQALQHVQRDVPDLIILDLELPGNNGIQTIDSLVKIVTCPLFLLTSFKSNDDPKIFEAMGHGALEVFNLPNDSINTNQNLLNEFAKKLVTLSRLLGKLPKSSKKVKSETHFKLIDSPSYPPLIVIGASTGGPMALSKILKKLTPRMKVAVVIIQHVDEKFAPGLAHWLSEQTHLNVKIAESGARPEQGSVYLSGKNMHLIMAKHGHLKYSNQPADKPHIPSIDEFFHSVGDHWPYKGIAVLLTGMGSDGAKGLLHLKRLGWHTIAEHEESCVVYGMPKAAIEINAATQVLQCDKIGNWIANIINQPHESANRQ